MSLFKKLFGKTVTKEDEVKDQEVHLSLEDAFVHHFITKGGKFLYCISDKEIEFNLNHILLENNWETVVCLNSDLKKYFKKSSSKSISNYDTSFPFFTNCEHLISDNGDILFSSNQIGSEKLAQMNKNFIVFAKTSQLVKNTGQGLTGIKSNSKSSIPTNISAIKSYQINEKSDDFLQYGNTNSKNLYLLLLEDL